MLAHNNSIKPFLVQEGVTRDVKFVPVVAYRNLEKDYRVSSQELYIFCLNTSVPRVWV
jgi:hypothetical protein